MRILAVDIGTGTQDILLFDPAGLVENCPRLVVPSPTAIAAGRIRDATATAQAVVITGVLSGGGPCHWALRDHLQAGLPGYATADAARTFDDDLDAVQADGVVLVSEDEARRIDGAQVVLRDLDLDAIRGALATFDVDTAFDGVAAGVLDHGAAPAGVSDRVFRFQHIERVLAEDTDLRAFAFRPGDLPAYLTRARAVLDSIDGGIPTVFMDTGPAAALGALHDARVAAAPRRLVLNAGNMHALAFVLHGTRIEATFEHHTGEVSGERLAAMARELAAGTLTGSEVFESQGHGVAYVGAPPFHPEVVAVTGPQREKVMPHMPEALPATPHGDMMIGGCFGLLDGFAYRYPEAREAVANLHPQAVAS